MCLAIRSHKSLMWKSRNSLTNARKRVTAATLIGGTRFATNWLSAASFWKTPKTACAGKESDSVRCSCQGVREADDLKIAQHASAGLRNQEFDNQPVQRAAEDVDFIALRTSAVRFTDSDSKLGRSSQR